jgi:hypothetical protein
MSELRSLAVGGLVDVGADLSALGSGSALRSTRLMGS